jgi:hypothetical protein
VTEALIDDMTGPNISFVPPPCATKGNWTVGVNPPGFLTTPAGDPNVLGNCGNLCQSIYSPLPSGFPGPGADFDAGTAGSDASVGDGGAAGRQAVCIAGQTSASQYVGIAGMAVSFGYSGPVPDGGPISTSVGNWYTTAPLAALVDASQYSGIQFWLWVSPDTVAATTSFLEVGFMDKWFTLGAVPDGGCDPYASGPSACTLSAAAIANSPVALSQTTGPVLDGDGGVLGSYSPGWQLVKVPWTSALSNPYYGGAVESAVDPTALAIVEIFLQQVLAVNAGGTSIPFDFCVYDLAFYR